MHAIEEHFRTRRMRDCGNASDVDDRTDRMRRHRAGDEPGALRHERLEVVDMEIAIFAHAPPFELGAGLFQRQPGGDVGVVVHVGDDDLVTPSIRVIGKHLADAEADQADERGGVHAEADFGRAVGVDQERHAFARFGDRLVDGDASAIAAAALDIVPDQMVGHRVEHALRDLRAGGVVHEDEIAGLPQRRKHSADFLDRERSGAVLRFRSMVLVHGRLLQFANAMLGRLARAGLGPAALFEVADEPHQRPKEGEIDDCGANQRRRIGHQPGRDRRHCVRLPTLTPVS